MLPLFIFFSVHKSIKHRELSVSRHQLSISMVYQYGQSRTITQIRLVHSAGDNHFAVKLSKAWRIKDMAILGCWDTDFARETISFEGWIQLDPCLTPASLGLTWRLDSQCFYHRHRIRHGFHLAGATCCWMQLNTRVNEDYIIMVAVSNDCPF